MMGKMIVEKPVTSQETYALLFITEIKLRHKLPFFDSTPVCSPSAFMKQIEGSCHSKLLDAPVSWSTRTLKFEKMKH